MYGSIDLVGVDLDLTPSNGPGIGKRRRLAYYGFDDYVAVPLIYDPLKKAGALFYDRSGDGIVDFFTLVMINGDYGDFGGGGASDQLISTCSSAAVVDGGTVTLTPFGTDSKTLTVADSGVSASPVNVALKASLVKRTSTSNRIGYVLLDAKELIAADSADRILTIGELKKRAQTLFQPSKRVISPCPRIPASRVSTGRSW